MADHFRDRVATVIWQAINVTMDVAIIAADAVVRELKTGDSDE